MKEAERKRNSQLSHVAGKAGLGIDFDCAADSAERFYTGHTDTPLTSALLV